tara:strand:- start:71 stop:736 length:666 start_codon:yes stop_codon:yes gene_type:complete
MPTYRGLKTAFVHIPKTAGSSIANRLYNENLKTGEDSLENEKHESILTIKGYLEPLYFHQYFKFAIVRNPYDRLVSWYHYYQDLWGSGNSCSDPCDPEHIKRFLDMDFDAYVAAIKKPHEWDCHKGIACPIHMIAPQYKYIIGFGNYILVDYVGKIEDIDIHWKAISERVGLEYNPLDILNKVEHDKYNKYYDHVPTRMKVDILYNEDFKYFGYSPIIKFS